MVFPTSGGEFANPENIEALYTSVRSLGTKEEDDISFPYWKGFDEYRDLVDPASLSDNLAAVFLEVLSLLNYRVEWTVTLYGITQNSNKFL